MLEKSLGKLSRTGHHPRIQFTSRSEMLPMTKILAFTGLSCAFLFACKGNAPSEVPVSGQQPSAESAETSEAVAPPESELAAPAEAAIPSIHSLTMTMLDGTETSLADWKGKPVLIVNTASQCGHTPQYEGLQALHAKYESAGFAVLGFPSNDFGGQEPGTSKEISTFCTSIYGVNFPMFEKVKTKGEERAPLYALLGDAFGEPQWNFHKYLINKQGQPIQAWASAVKPRSEEVVAAIEKAIAAQ